MKREVVLLVFLICSVFNCWTISGLRLSMISAPERTFGSLCATFVFGSSVTCLLTPTISPAIASESALSRMSRKGMDYFRQLKVAESLRAFDAIIAEDRRYAPYLWQRGISLYLLGDYQAAYDQFRMDVEVNSNDNEEIIWGKLCERKSRFAATGGQVKSNEENGRTVSDPRKVINLVALVLKGTENEGALKDVATAESSPSDFFYSRLYLSLLCDSNNQEKDALVYAKEAVNSYYGKNSKDYMTSVAAALFAKLSDRGS